MNEQRMSRVDIVFGWSLKINKIHVHEIDTEKKQHITKLGVKNVWSETGNKSCRKKRDESRANVVL